MGGRLTLAPATWRVRAASVTGASHVARGEHGQDAARTAALDDGRVVVAVADGAGSAPRAAEGSRIAVDTAIDAVASGAALEEVFERAAAALGDDAPDKATTLLVAVIADEVIDAGQVGDGFVVARRGGVYEVIGTVDDREYLNETTFLSSPGWRDALQVTTVEAAEVDGVALMTDGLQLVAIELATSTPHPGFFDPLLAWAASDAAGDDELVQFLSSPRLAERSDDDLTLALVVRLPAT